MTNDGTTDNLYFEWLYGQVGSVKNRNPARSYWHLFKQLHSREFTWFVPNDDNRVADGKELRDEFIAEYDLVEVDPYWVELGCSVLEMLVALSRRLAFQTIEPASEWFWIMAQNLDIRQYTDEKYNNRSERVVDEVLDRVIDRTYSKDGSGGLFPLRKPVGNQRSIEIWYQMSAYLLENEYAEFNESSFGS